MYPTLIASIWFLVSNRCSALLLPTVISVSNNGSSPGSYLKDVLLNSTTLHSGEIQCNDQRLGRDLNKRSCWNAWDKMPRSSDQHELHPRLPGGRTGVPTLSKLPIRYLSDDGLCAIDVSLSVGSKGDTTTDRAIAGAARSVLFECVETHGSGGRLEVPCKSMMLSKEVFASSETEFNANYGFAKNR